MDCDNRRDDALYSEEIALARRLAGQYRARGTRRLGLDGRVVRRLSRALAEARRLRRTGEGGDEALTRLVDAARLIEACARRARAEGGDRLPAWGRRTRLEALLVQLCAGGRRALTRDGLTAALSALDAAQGLTDAELWAVPEALRVVACRQLQTVAERVVRRGGDCAAAARWVRRPGGDPSGRGDAFIEAAARLAGEEGLSKARGRLDEALSRRGETVEAAAQRARAARAADLLRLENLMDMRRLADGMNWRACFEALSRTERALREDPAGVYVRMDAESRDAVRVQANRLARRLGLDGEAVARAAVDAARAEEDGVGVCRWLYDDAGRAALTRKLGGGRAPRLVPDPSGVGTVAVRVALTALLTLPLCLAASAAWLYPACFVLAWAASDALVSRFFSLLFSPARLLKLELDPVPEDARTLVVMPVLLSSKARARSILDQLEALGCLEEGRNVSYLLLGDFADAPEREMPGDGAIQEEARARVAALNGAAGWDKYALLIRQRTLSQPDHIWMGRDRKRGALEDLNRLLVGVDGAEAAFQVEGAACERLRGRFDYVVTLDADTRALPFELRRLVGAMAHPLNRARGYAVLQPRMEATPSACVNDFVRLFAGVGGVGAYPTTASNLWQDVTGRGIYGGKGVYDVRAFHDRLDGALPEGRVLSHDLIEGAVAGAGFAGDVAFYDASPASLPASLRRLHRWTRGDWQLVPFIFAPRLQNGARLGVAHRFMLLDNLLRSLRDAALMALIVASVWLGRGEALLAALMLNYLDALLRLGDGDKLKWRRATAALATLPATAWCRLDAAARALWRLGASHRRLLDWVTAADAERGTGERSVTLPAIAAALLLLPGLLTPGWARAGLALIALFLAGPGWLRDMARTGTGDALTAKERQALKKLARDTWRFFEANVRPGAGEALPPDNVQLDPPTGAARRTSPTNIALYLLSCLAAGRLGLADAGDVLGRIGAAVSALEALPKWRGNLYNWYDIDTGAPLRPRYVSAVDSGNLAAALLACANAPEVDGALSARLAALARGTDLSALYDGDRELFRIGWDGEADRPGAGHYDLIASESRILSFTAMVLGQVPERHWRRLGRPCARVGGGVAPLSWSGTLFEFLMPELLMAAPTDALLGEAARAATRAQIDFGARRGRPWGVSESGHCALDARLNYQYRAFGLPELALDGAASARTVAPYASALALSVAPREAARNLMRMVGLGWSGAWGLYEAADYGHADAEGRPALVMSHMAHHQGMALCAICNALTGNSLRADYMGLPGARALSLLLEERPCPKAPRKRPEPRVRNSLGDGAPDPAWTPDAASPYPQTLLMSGGDCAALITSDGAVHYWRGDVAATRFEGTLIDRRDAARVCLACDGAGMDWSEVRFEPGLARFSARLGRVAAELTVCLSPEDGTLHKRVALVNRGDAPARVVVADVAPVALSRENAWRDHAAFQKLFVESRCVGEGLLLFERRPGRGDGDPTRLAHLCVGPGALTYDTDDDRLAGRLGDARRTGVLDKALPNAAGTSLNPAAAQRLTLTLDPGERAEVRFAMALLNGDDDLADWVARWRGEGRGPRTERLSSAEARAALGFLGLSDPAHRTLQRLAALVFDGALAAEARGMRMGEGPVRRADLWPMGISGDRPILLGWLRGPGDAGGARALVRAHGFYRGMGVGTDLVLVDDGAGGYARPCRDMAEDVLASSHLNRLRGVSGGAWLLDGACLTPDQRRALERFATLSVDADGEVYARIRALTATGAAAKAALREMDIGPSTLAPQLRLLDNGYGGFASDGGYAIDVTAQRPTPAPWSNILASDAGGTLLTERGGGWFWRGNSREQRLTPYGNDGMCEGWGVMLYLVAGGRGEWLRLLPGDVPQMPFTVSHSPRESRYSFENRRLAGEVAFSVDPDLAETLIDVRLENRGLRGEAFTLWAYVDWLMGAARRDATALNCWQAGGACYATGAMDGVGWLTVAGPHPTLGGPGRKRFLGRGGMMAPSGFGETALGEGWALGVPLRLGRGTRAFVRLALGSSEDVDAARARVAALRNAPICRAVPPKAKLEFETPDPALNALANGFLLHQVTASRVLGRTGLNQPGGAWGFRDQLQDMLALLHQNPARVRAHLLVCAARQFEAGDVMHWWHAPLRGVRTKISDDLLFLPWVAAAYVALTGDAGVLEERAAYLEDEPIPQGAEDLYREMRPGGALDTLHGHCMRAFRHADRRGVHGLLLMGAGDWNDGMNRVGAAGRGESVWLSEFCVACAEKYRRIAPVEADRVYLWRLAEELRMALEARAWDDGWYLRAFDDDGRPLGGAACDACQIDVIAQAWAALSGLDPVRCDRALDAVWARLVDGEAGIIRLLIPPFDGASPDPGYIRAYPPGVRENGGQYTHGALWLLLALIERGDADRAHRALQMLLPCNHARTPGEAAVYRAEPYVMAADVYDCPGHRGQGGWTWYTGAAGWMYTCILALLGYERRGDRARLRALLGDWPAASVTLAWGRSRYRLTCDATARAVTLDGVRVEGDWVRLVDDAGRHEAVFPPRGPTNPPA